MKMRIKLNWLDKIIAKSFIKDQIKNFKFILHIEFWIQPYLGTWSVRKCTEVLNSTDHFGTLINKLIPCGYCIYQDSHHFKYTNKYVNHRTTRSTHCMHLSQLVATKSVKIRPFSLKLFSNFSFVDSNVASIRCCCPS